MTTREQPDLGEDQPAVRGAEQRLGRGHLDQRLDGAGQQQRGDRERRPARPDRQDRAQLPLVGLAQQEAGEHDQPAQPDRHAAPGGRRRPPRRPPAPGTPPGARPAARWPGPTTPSIASSARSAATAAAAGQQRAEQEGGRRQHAEPDQVRGAERAAEDTAEPVAGRRRRAAAGRVGRLQPQRRPAVAQRPPDPRPVQASRVGPRRESRRGQSSGEHQRRPDQQHQAGVAEVAGDLDRRLHDRGRPRLSRAGVAGGVRRRAHRVGEGARRPGGCRRRSPGS